VLPVLFEKPGRHDGQLVGRSPYLQAVHAVIGPEPIDKGPIDKEWIGVVVPVMIDRAEPNSLAGTVAAGEPASSARADMRLSDGAAQAEYRT